MLRVEQNRLDNTGKIMILYMITGLPTLELEADSDCNAYYVMY